MYVKWLPCDDLIQKRLLLSAGPGQIDPRCLDAFVSEDICKKRDIAVPFQKVLRKTVPEGMRIYCIGVDSVTDCKMLETGMDSTDCHRTAVLVKEEETAGLPSLMTPFECFIAEGICDINSADFPAF